MTYTYFQTAYLHFLAFLPFFVMYKKRENAFSAILFILICLAMQVLILFFIINNVMSSSLRLEKVVILSRHGVRTPVSTRLNKLTPNKWPEWKEKPGELTKRGFKLEGFMGSYFSTWLAKNELLPQGCPDENDFFVYANSVQRTIASAHAFVYKAFPDCNVTIHSSKRNPDPTFAAVIHNKTDIFKKIAETEMQAVIDKLELDKSYEELEKILTYQDSEYCKQENMCHLSKEGNKPKILPYSKPVVSGALKKSKEAVDAFLMSLFNGLPNNMVAWGKLSTKEQWHSIVDLMESYHDIVFKTNIVAKDVAGPLLNYMKKVFLYKNNKVTLLMGHDANINVILNVLSFKEYYLSNSLISIPIGGKLVFQKWFDFKLNKNLLKVEYVYQSTSQVRNVVPLSIETPPQFYLLELNNYKMVKKGFYLWDDFVSLLNNI